MLELLTIEELAEKSGLPIRTIRFYITEGLLPSPQTRGRNAAYTEEALDRLILIQRLKDAHLPLKEIRDQLNALSPARIHQLAREQDQKLYSLNDDIVVSAPTAETDSALGYISRILEARSVYKHTEQPSLQSPAASSRALRSPHPSEPAENWQRIEIAPGVELHIREPLDSSMQKKISQMIEMIKIIFQ